MTLSTEVGTESSITLERRIQSLVTPIEFTLCVGEVVTNQLRKRVLRKESTFVGSGIPGMASVEASMRLKRPRSVTCST